RYLPRFLLPSFAASFAFPQVQTRRNQSNFRGRRKRGSKTSSLSGSWHLGKEICCLNVGVARFYSVDPERKFSVCLILNLKLWLHALERGVTGCVCASEGWLIPQSTEIIHSPFSKQVRQLCLFWGIWPLGLY
uniref:Uncharacterized protein n=1 Tax=Laticauda laticaudata TaxID=8630 RepID=A0A8C5SY53_LATLA